jgi:tetratricopeptide (TPR) repeat protein
VHDFRRTLSGMAAVAALGAIVMTGNARPARAQAQGAQAQPGQAEGGQPPAGQAPAAQKKYKDQGEYDIYNEVFKDVQTQNWQKAVTDLNTWKQKYPQTDYSADRLYFYLQAYNGTKQPAKVLDTAAELMSKDLKTEFTDPKSAPQQIVAVYYMTAVNLPQIPNPSPEQLALGDKAAHALLDYLPTFFSEERKPAATSAADWAKARAQLEAVANSSLTYIAMRPGMEAAQKQDWQGAADAYTKALEQHPDNAQISYQLGSALIRTRKPENVNEAIYEMARAAALDPSKGGITNAKDRADIEAYLNKIYTSVHGSTEGLDQIKQQAVNSPLPPPGFAVKTQAQIAAEKEQQFEQTNPELALWMKIKGQLVDANGDDYFKTQLKDANVPQLRGTLVEAKPACHPKELLVAVPLPNAQQPLKPEITLKLDEPLTGKPGLNQEFHFQGVPTAFTKDPFMLTMDTEKAKVEGLKEEKCVVAPAHKAVRKGVTKKK